MINLKHTLLELNMANRPIRFFSLPAVMVPFTVIDSALWAPMPDDTYVLPPDVVWDAESPPRLKSSNGISPGGSNPDLYFSITKNVS